MSTFFNPGARFRRMNLKNFNFRKAYLG